MKIVKYLPYLALLLLVPLLMGPAADIPEKLAIGTPNWNTTIPMQSVMIDGEEVDFEAHIRLCASRKDRGFGFIAASDGDGVKWEMVPVYGATLREEDDGIILILRPVVVREGVSLPDGFVVVIVRPVPGSPNRYMFDMKIGDRSVSFEVDEIGDKQPNPGRCESVDFGQLTNTYAAIEVVEQAPESGPEAIIGFAASLSILPTNEALGFIDVILLRQPTARYHALCGALFRDGDTGLHSAELVLLRDDPERSDPLSTNADVLLVSSKVKELESNEDELFWDLVNGTTGQVNGTVEVIGGFKSMAGMDH